MLQMLGKEKIFPEFVQYIPLFLLKHNKYWKYSMILIKPRNNFFTIFPIIINEKITWFRSSK